MSRTLSEIALESETRLLLKQLKIRQEYLPRKIKSHNQAVARAEEWYKKHDPLPDDLSKDESPKSTKPKKKSRKKTTAKKLKKKAEPTVIFSEYDPLENTAKEFIHPEPSVAEILEDTASNWPLECLDAARRLRMQGHPCGRLESAVCNCEEWPKQPAEVELRIVEGLIEYLEATPDERTVIAEEWSKFRSPTQWARVLGLSSSRVFTTRCNEGKIKHEKLDSKNYRLAMSELPSEDG